jgi:hypothetical protein
VAYLPHSNILVLLPTIRADRFWYVPAMGMAWLLGAGIDRLWATNVGRAEDAGARPRMLRWRRAAIAVLFGAQALAARVHALAYTNDLWFWRITRWASPNSAKAHLNYAVMLGARGHREARLKVGSRALQIAPNWPMAQVYHADALCRLRHSDQAWPYYVRGWTLAPDNKSLVALGLQCLWETGQFEQHRAKLRRLADAHPDTWLAYLIVDVLRHGKDQGGVAPKDRPRAYNQGPKT